MRVLSHVGASMFAKADVEINGGRPWDLQVQDPERLFRKTLFGGTLAFCEAYMNGEWQTDDLFEMLRRLFNARVDRTTKGFSDFALRVRHALINAQSAVRSFQVGEKHYSLGNAFYAQMLDPSMTYSCARWQGVSNLADAQLQKRRLLAQKLQLQPGMTVLDIGCGWGELARYLAAEYDVSVTGVTISTEQAKWAMRLCADVPVQILVQDYRELEGMYDRVVSVGMAEHVGTENYPTYMRTAAQHLNTGGLFVCHAIIGVPGGKAPFVDKYIFPGGEIGATWQIQKAAEEAGFKVEDWENFGHDYYLTLMAWDERFTKNWDAIEPLIGPEIISVFGSVDRFKRAWKLYLIGFAAKFNIRDLSVGQWVLSKGWQGSVCPSFRL